MRWWHSSKSTRRKKYVIQLDEVHIEETRGIRKLTLPLNRKSFAIHGPNGSGKSGVVDAIEFGLTGDMTRLSGKGTGGLTVKTHGPHVDARDYPDSAFVRLKIYLPLLNKSATLVRKVKKPSEPQISPADADIVAALSLVAEHPEITLTRRQIIRFILTEATTRSKDIQALLRLDSIDQTRGLLKTASNRTGASHVTAQAASTTAEDAFRRHLDLSKLKTADVLTVVNKHRATLKLPELTELKADTSLKKGLLESKSEPDRLNKESSLRDVQALLKQDETDRGATPPEKRLLEQLDTLKSEPDLLAALQRRTFVQKGLELVTEDACPLCDNEWDMEKLKTHLRQKIERSKVAESLETALRSARTELAGHIDSLRESIAGVRSHARVIKDEPTGAALDKWSTCLSAFKEKLQTIEGAEHSREQLTSGWNAPTTETVAALETLETTIKALPEKSEAVQANNFLVLAQERLDVYRKAKRNEARLGRAAKLAASAYKAYCDAAESVLNALYEDVQESFAELYRLINKDDEGEFKAKLSPADGKLDLTVDFHKRGLFPPGAYHSEGHQDGMGLCLYLALMKQLQGEQFLLAVFDDVVMSVDSQHRKEVCNLLRSRFPNTQFVITTHEQAWFHQMRNAGLVNKASCVRFRGWTVDDGPLVDEAMDAWETIDGHLAKEEVSQAAAVLRRHLEHVSNDLASNLGALTPHRPDGGHDLGEMLPNVISRLGELLGKAADSAQAWKNEDGKKKVAEFKSRFRECATKSNVEQWVLNPAVHYNAWADFVRQDFAPVVTAFKELVACFVCSGCGSWLYASPRKGSPETLRCDCSHVSFNLTKPQKS